MKNIIFIRFFMILQLFISTLKFKSDMFTSSLNIINETILKLINFKRAELEPHVLGLFVT
jgi:hypothetical protein